jgi:putative MATE family efflux protein
MIMIEAVGVACLRGAGDMLSGLVVMASTNAVNIVVSWALVLGPGPIPKLGWEGIAVGTACGHTFGALLIVVMMARGRSGLAVRWPMLGPDRDLIRRLLRVGVPGGMDTLLIILCHLWFVAVINRLGDLAAAAHGVAIRIESLAFLSGTAFQVAATTMSGQYLGARDHRKAGRSVLLACLVGGGVMTMAGVIFFAIPLPLARLFVRTDQLDVALTAVPLLRIVAVGMPALAVAMILNGALRGAGDTRWPLLFSLIGFLGVRIPLAYWLAFEQLSMFGGTWPIDGWNLGVVGTWYAMLVDLHVRAVLVLYRFFHGGWKRVEV